MNQHFTRIAIGGLILLSPLSAACAQSAASEVVTSTQLGTTVVGQQEAAIGLFVNPWKEQQASTTDRPPRLLDIPYAPVDPQAFVQALQWQHHVDSLRLQQLHR